MHVACHAMHVPCNACACMYTCMYLALHAVPCNPSTLPHHSLLATPLTPCHTTHSLPHHSLLATPLPPESVYPFSLSLSNHRFTHPHTHMHTHQDALRQWVECGADLMRVHHSLEQLVQQAQTTWWRSPDLAGLLRHVHVSFSASVCVCV